MVKQLEEYFDKTPREQIEKDWNESSECDSIGCTVDEFVENTCRQTYELTSHLKRSKHCDGKFRNVLQYYLNGVLILEQKYPFDADFDYGYQFRTDIKDEYLLNGNLHQTRQYESSHYYWWRCSKQKKEGKVRHVKYPISKKVLSQFNIPKDVKIYL